MDLLTLRTSGWLQLSMKATYPSWSIGGWLSFPYPIVPTCLGRVEVQAPTSCTIGVVLRAQAQLGKATWKRPRSTWIARKPLVSGACGLT